MDWLKQNWKKFGLIIIISGILFFLMRGLNGNSYYKALVSEIIFSPIPSPIVISENEQKFIDLEKSLPRFKDYPVKVYIIPPKPKLNHESNPYGMRFWTLTENRVNMASSYNMGGHYLMGRYATGNPDMLIIDGLTGQVFHEYGSLYFSSVANSSLVIFDPIDIKCFSSNGDYEPCYRGKGNPRYAVWDGKQFNTVCEPTVKAWELVSCGKKH